MMTLPETLSLRDYFAAQALPIFRHITVGGSVEDLINETSRRAYIVADAMLAKREKDGRLRDHEIEGLTRRAETVERSLEIFQASADYIPRVALTQLWELLDVKEQTHAVQRIKELREGVKICLDAERERRRKLKPGAPATTYTDERIAMLESLVS